MIQCNDCKKEIGAEAKKCIHCGTKTMYGKKEDYKMSAAICIGLGLGLAGIRFTILPYTNHSDLYLSFVTVFMVFSLIWGIYKLIKSKKS